MDLSHDGNSLLLPAIYFTYEDPESFIFLFLKLLLIYKRLTDKLINLWNLTHLAMTELALLHNTKIRKCSTRSDLCDIPMRLFGEAVNRNPFFFLARWLPMAKCDLEVRVYYSKATL